MTTYFLMAGYVLGVEATMSIMTLSPWWIASYIVTLLLLVSGKTMNRLVNRWIQND